MAKKTLEELAKEIYKEYAKDGEPCTMEEALEVAKMEMGAKDVKIYAQSDKSKEKKKREIKLDDVKVSIIANLAEMVEDNLSIGYENVKIANPQKEITFTVKGEEYSISLIKHRKKG